MPYIANTSAYPVARNDQGIAQKFQTMVVSSFAEDKFIVIDKEIKGGLHRVKYKGQLTESVLYDGIMSSKRTKGMLVYVELEDNDTPCGKYYSLKMFPGNLLSHWEEIGAGSSITITNSQTTPTIITRNALTPINGDFVTVIDARTESELLANSPLAYAKSFIWNGTTWIAVTMYGDNPNNHIQGTDFQLIRQTDNSVVTADSIAIHMLNTAKHKNLNDGNDDGAVGEDWSSLKIRTEINKKVTKITTGDGNSYLSNNGTYKVITGGTGSGLNKGDILNGGNSLTQ